MKNKLSIILYYVCTLLSILIFIISFLNDYPSLLILSVINTVAAIVFTILLPKRNLNNYKLSIPIVYIVFYIIMAIVVVLYKSKWVSPYEINSMYDLIPIIQYYAKFVLIAYTTLNIYSLLSLETKKPIIQ